jgi:hypothetical protein
MKKAETGRIEKPAPNTKDLAAERTRTRAHKRVVTQTERDEVAIMRPPVSPDRPATKEPKDKTE